MGSRLLQTLSGVVYFLLLLATICVTLLSSFFLLSQAVRTSPSQTFKDNANAVVIGAAYALVALATLFLYIRRKIATRLKLHRISRVHRTIRRGDVPNSVYEYILQEYARTSVISRESLPTDIHHPGWTKPGSQHGLINFSRELLRTITVLDKLAHAVIPRHPPLRPNSRMLHHFRFIMPLLEKDDDDLTALHYYDSAIQLARVSSRPPTETEYEMGMEAAGQIQEILEGCYDEMRAESESMTMETWDTNSLKLKASR